MFYSGKRQRFLINQGYSFKVRNYWNLMSLYKTFAHPEHLINQDDVHEWHVQTKNIYGLLLTQIFSNLLILVLGAHPGYFNGTCLSAICNDLYTDSEYITTIATP